MFGNMKKVLLCVALVGGIMSGNSLGSETNELFVFVPDSHEESGFIKKKATELTQKDISALNQYIHREMSDKNIQTEELTADYSPKNEKLAELRKDIEEENDDEIDNWTLDEMREWLAGRKNDYLKEQTEITENNLMEVIELIQKKQKKLEKQDNFIILDEISDLQNFSNTKSLYEKLEKTLQ